MDRGMETVRFDTVRGSGRMMDGNEWSAERGVELVIRLALVAVFLWAVIMVVKYLVKYLNAHSNTDTMEPTEIVKQRLARGEITKSEFEQLKKDLK